MERGRPAPETGSQARTLWVSLPGEVARRFRPHTDNLGKKILEAIQREVPEYAKPLEGGFGSVIIKAIEEAVIGSIDSIGGLPSTQDKWGAMFREVGRGVHKGGGSLDSLQASYRVGGQAAWRYIAAWGQRTGMPTPLLCVCAEAIFAVIEEISSYSVEGYTVAQTKAAGTLERCRMAAAGTDPGDAAVVPAEHRRHREGGRVEAPGARQRRGAGIPRRPAR